MSLSGAAETRTVPSLDRALAVAVPVALAVVTWLGLLFVVGFLARLNRLSVLNLLPLFFVGLLFWPVARAAPWREGVTDRARTWTEERAVAFVVVAGLALLPLVPFVPDLLVSVLQLPYRGSGIFFGASLFYRERLGPTAARALLLVAQWYLQLLWLYLVSIGLVGLVRRLR